VRVALLCKRRNALDVQLKHAFMKIGICSPCCAPEELRPNPLCFVWDAEPTQRVNGHIAIIASPPDARYAPLHAGGPRTFGAVRALVFPLTPGTTSQAGTGRPCQRTQWLSFTT
jgi:hypothetical protein